MNFRPSSIIITNLLKRCYSNENGKYYDIIIAGGGMVGTTLACALGKQSKLASKSILLLESGKKSQQRSSAKYSNRVVALTPLTKKLLCSIGAWNEIEHTRFGTVNKMQVWDACSDAMITFNNDDLTDELAFIVENDLLLSSVTKVLESVPNVTLINEAKISDYNLPKDVNTLVKVDMDDGKCYTCSLLLGADGLKSKVREKMGVNYLNWDYNQMGVVAVLNLCEPCENVIAWQRFLPTGPVALLPLNECQSSLIWTTNPQQAKELLKLSEEQFVDALNDALWKTYRRDDLIDSVTKGVNTLLESLNFPSNAVRQLPPSVKSIEENSRAMFPFGFGHATNYVARSVALVGDAAHRCHPLAGQGVNLGFGDVLCLVEVLAEAVYSGRNLGSLLHLKEYESIRQKHNFPTMLAIDGLQKLYSTDLTPIVALRSLGLQITHAMKPVKKMIMEHASN